MASLPRLWLMPYVGDAESVVSWKALAPARIRRNGMEPIGNDGPALSEFVDSLFSAVCLFRSRLTWTFPKPFFPVSDGLVSGHSLSLRMRSMPSC